MAPPAPHERFLRLHVIARGSREVATARVRDAFQEAGAFITDVHFFSGVQTVLQFEVDGARVAALHRALVAAGVELDADGAAALERARGADGELQGTIAVTFADGDPDLTHEIPSVPG